MRKSLICFGLMTLMGSATQAQEHTKNAYYSTCPDLQHAKVRSVAYKEVSEADLIRWAKLKPRPKRSVQLEEVHIQVQVEGEHVFCAQALDGSPEKQRAAVSAAMLWRFKKNRGDFNSDVMGKITFLF